MRRIFLICLGALMAAVGLVINVLPIPLPGVGLALLIGGIALLCAHSRNARRLLQRARRRSAPLSRTVERFAERAPASIRRTLSRTRPDAIARQIKMAERNPART